MTPSLVLNHYTSGTGLVGILDSGSIWASNIHQLNDAMEFKHALELAKSEITQVAAKNPNRQAHVLGERLIDLVDRCYDFSVYVTSFSEVRDSLSQWRGYCPSGFGYSIGFDEQHLRTAATAQGFALSRCIYDGAKQREIISEWAQRTFDHLIENLDPAENTHDTDNVIWPRMMSLLVHAPFLKHSSFSDEREWRMTRVVNRNDPQLKLRASEHMLIRYLPVPLPLSTESEIIWDVCVGPTPHPNLALESITHYLHKMNIRNGICPSQTPYRSW